MSQSLHLAVAIHIEKYTDPFL